MALLTRYAGAFTFCGVGTGLFDCGGPPVHSAADARDACLTPEWHNIQGSSDSPQFEGIIATDASGPHLYLDRERCFVVGGKQQFEDVIALDNISKAESATFAGHRVLVSGRVQERGGRVRVDVESSTTVL